MCTRRQNYAPHSHLGACGLCLGPLRFSEKSLTETELARRVGVSQPSVRKWIHQAAKPEAHHRKALERILGIPEDDWMDAAERAIAEGTGEDDAA